MNHNPVAGCMNYIWLMVRLADIIIIIIVVESTLYIQGGHDADNK